MRAWDTLPAPLRAALTGGATVVTPNKRLARRLAALHDAEQRAAGREAWSAARVVPWAGWVSELWLDALAASPGANPPRLVRAGQSAHLWSRIVADDAPALVDARGAAALAADAWSLVHAWGEGGPSWRGWAGGGDDCAAFARWADAYARELVRIEGVDDAMLPNWLAGVAAGVSSWRGVDVLLAGFVELSPRQERLLAALTSAGMRIAREATLPDAALGPCGQIRRATAATPRDELVRALHWARGIAQSDPAAVVGIAIEDLPARREEVRALAEEILCPALQWPGSEAAVRPYNLSLGVALAEHPLVRAAIDLVALAHAPLPIGRAAALLRVPFVAGGHAGWARRAALEPEWLADGHPTISLDEAIAALAACGDPAAARWRSARDALRLPASAAPRAWTDVWRAWLTALGWPGERTLSSAEWQAHGAWEELLSEFAMLAPVARRLSRGEAAASLAAMAMGRVFQPESPPAPIQILGLLEATGLPLDALWVAGLAAENWPPAPRPNPLLPLDWQRARNVPHASAARELDYARALTAQWARGAEQVVFSCARSVDDRERSPSALVPDAPALPDADLRPATARTQFAAAPPLERVADERAPAIAPGSAVKGGAALIEAQSDCPFRAVAAHRLRAEPWPASLDGLSPGERGSLVHVAFAALWRGLGNQAALLALDDAALGERVDDAIAVAVASLPAPRWRRLPAVVRSGEAARIATVVRAWIDGFDRLRPPFTVAAIEVSRALAISGLQLALRIDRIDALADGGTAIIDYKTGRVKSPPSWFESRPESPQLGLYLLAQQACAPGETVRAVAYAQLKPGELAARGIAADAGVWDRLPTPDTVKKAGLADWDAAVARWRETLAVLADEFRDGRASVAPRDAGTCRNCGLQPLCRVGSLSVADEGDEDAEA